MIWRIIYEFFSYAVFFYSVMAIIFLIILTIMSLRAQRSYTINMPDFDTIRYFLKGSPLTPAVSIIAPAFNEQDIVVENVKSMLKVLYPNFDVIIVNDGSTDDTLKNLIEAFELSEVPFTNTRKVPCKPIRKVFRSRNEQYYNLIVVDKEPGGRKADASNAGINITENKYFVCTDSDCYIDPRALYRMMWVVVNSHYPMIGVSATMLLGNNCVIEDGVMKKLRVPNSPLPLYQELEYMRSFLIGKMGWSAQNTLPNISGGFGLFDTEVVIKSGGYDPNSFAEDVDLLLRMVTYMHNTGQEYRVAQLPRVSCWTEAPFSLRTLYKQRTRWARGLCEIISNHWKLFFNPKYGRMGTVVLPYIFVFEFLAPIIELCGIVFMFWLIWTGGINWTTATVIFGMVYFFALSLTSVVLIMDYYLKVVEWKNTALSYLKLFFAGATESIIFNPILTLFTLIGYFKFATSRKKVWDNISRQGWKKSKEGEN